MDRVVNWLLLWGFGGILEQGSCIQSVAISRAVDQAAAYMDLNPYKSYCIKKAAQKAAQN